MTLPDLSGYREHDSGSVLPHIFYDELTSSSANGSEPSVHQDDGKHVSAERRKNDENVQTINTGHYEQKVGEIPVGNLIRQIGF